MSRGIGDLQRRILAFAYATNRHINGGQYAPPPGIWRVDKHGGRFIRTHAIGDLHKHGAMSFLFGLKRLDPRAPWTRQDKRFEQAIVVKPNLDRSWFDASNPRWKTARSTVSRAVSNLFKRGFLADVVKDHPYNPDWKRWLEDDRAANLGFAPPDNRYAKGMTLEQLRISRLAQHYEGHADATLTPEGVAIAEKETAIEFDFVDLFGFDPSIVRTRDMKGGGQ